MEGPGACPYCRKAYDDHAWAWVTQKEAWVPFCLGNAPLPPPIGPASKR